MRRSPVFLLTAVCTLGLGIGATTAIFSLFYQVLLRELPVRQPQHLYVLHQTSGLPGWSMSDNFESIFSYPMYRRLHDGSSAVSEGMIARAFFLAHIMRGGATERAQGEVVSGNFFDVLGVHPYAGRLFTAADDSSRGGNHVAVLGYAFWSEKYGSANIIGQTIRINNDPITVIAIAPPDFRSVLHSGHGVYEVRDQVRCRNVRQDRKRILNHVPLAEPTMDSGTWCTALDIRAQPPAAAPERCIAVLALCAYPPAFGFKLT